MNKKVYKKPALEYTSKCWKSEVRTTERIKLLETEQETMGFCEKRDYELNYLRLKLKQITKRGVINKRVRNTERRLPG